MSIIVLSAGRAEPTERQHRWSPQGLGLRGRQGAPGNGAERRVVSVGLSEEAEFPAIVILYGNKYRFSPFALECGDISLSSR